MSFDPVRVVAALRVLADALDGAPSPAAEAPASIPAAATPIRRGRGRPVTGETPPASAAPAASPAVAEDPFAPGAPAPAAPTASLEQVREALTKLKEATSQDNALKVLKEASGGVSNLTDLQKTPEKYGAVVLAATAALPTAQQPESDPFETQAAPAVAEPAPSLEDVKAAVVEAQKRTATDKVQAVVMKHGGVAAGANGKGPSLKALPIAAYAAVIAEVKALPTTK